MTRILAIDLENQRMRVQPGVINLDVSRAIAPTATITRPIRRRRASARSAATSRRTPAARTASSTASRSTTSSAPRSCTAEGEIVEIGSAGADPLGLRPDGASRRQRRPLGIVTEVVVRILRTPEATRTFFATFPSTDEAGACVSGSWPRHRAGGDRDDGSLAIEAIVKATGVDWPLDVGAALLMDVDGVPPRSITPLRVPRRVDRAAQRRDRSAHAARRRASAR
jgi:glycolate oxidase